MARPNSTTRGHRLAALGAIASVAGALVCITLSAINNLPILVAETFAVLVAVVSGWFMVTRRGSVRLVAAPRRALPEPADADPVSLASEPVLPPARRAVLLMNPKSGGGKTERFHLVDECRKRGIEPIVLKRDDDLHHLVGGGPADPAAAPRAGGLAFRPGGSHVQIDGA